MTFISTINWETLIGNVTLDAVTHYYHIDVPPKNLSDVGAGTVAVGYYVVDYLGYVYKITAINVGGDPERVTVYDINEGEQFAGASFKAPYDGQIGFVYKANTAGSLWLSQSQLRRLSHSARDVVNQIDNNIIWDRLVALAPSYGTQDQIPHMNAGGTDYDYDSDFKWSDKLTIIPPGTIGSSTLANAGLLLGTTSVGLGMDTNEIYTKGSSLNIGTLDGDDITFRNAAAIIFNINSSGNVTTGTWTSDVIAHEYGGLEADVSAYAGLVKISGGTTSYITDSSTNWDTAYTHSQDNTQAHSDYVLNNAADNMSFTNNTA
jgi:hypothetical protein